MSGEQESKPRDSWRATIIWSLVLALLAFGAVWAITGWKTFHLAYCKRLMASENAERQIEGIMKAGATHLRQGLSRQEVERIFSPARLDGPMQGSYSNLKKSTPGEGFYLAHPRSTDDGIALVFDQDNKLVRWWTAP